MDIDPNEQFAGNRTINADIHEILAGFGEPSRSRMRRKIVRDRNTLLKQGTDLADQHALHTFREFLAAYQLNCNGYSLEYSLNIDGQTPDWYDDSHKLLLEVFTLEKGGALEQKIPARITEKINRYETLVERRGLHFVVSVHCNFDLCVESDDFQRIIQNSTLFQLNTVLSGAIHFDASHIITIQRDDGTKRHKQIYNFSYFANPNAKRPINLADKLAYL